MAKLILIVKTRLSFRLSPFLALKASPKFVHFLEFSIGSLFAHF